MPVHLMKKLHNMILHIELRVNSRLDHFRICADSIPGTIGKRARLFFVLHTPAAVFLKNWLDVTQKMRAVCFRTNANLTFELLAEMRRAAKSASLRQSRNR